MPLILILHIVFMSFMALFLVAGVTIARLKPKGWYQIHPKISATGTLFGVIGFIIIFVDKIIEGSHHFQILHEQLGVGAIAFMLIAASTGIFLKKIPKKYKGIHRYSGRVAILIVIVTTFIGFQLIL